MATKKPTKSKDQETLKRMTAISKELEEIMKVDPSARFMFFGGVQDAKEGSYEGLGALGMSGMILGEIILDNKSAMQIVTQALAYAVEKSKR